MPASKKSNPASSPGRARRREVPSGMPGGETGKAVWVWCEELYLGWNESKLRKEFSKMTDPEGRPMPIPRKGDNGSVIDWKRALITNIAKNTLAHTALTAGELATCESAEILQRECRRRGVKPVPNGEMMKDALFPVGPNVPLPPLRCVAEVPDSKEEQRDWVPPMKDAKFLVGSEAHYRRADGQFEKVEIVEVHLDSPPHPYYTIKFSGGRTKNCEAGHLAESVAAGRLAEAQGEQIGRELFGDKEAEGQGDGVEGGEGAGGAVTLSGSDKVQVVAELMGCSIAAAKAMIEKRKVSLAGGVEAPLDESLAFEEGEGGVTGVVKGGEVEAEPWRLSKEMVRVVQQRMGLSESEARNMCQVVPGGKLIQWVREEAVKDFSTGSDLSMGPVKDPDSEAGKGSDEAKGDTMLGAIEAIAQKMVQGLNKGSEGLLGGKSRESMSSEELLSQGATSLWDYGAKSISIDGEDKRAEYERWVQLRKDQLRGTVAATRAHQVLDELGSGKWVAWAMNEESKALSGEAFTAKRGIYEYQRSNNKRLEKQLAILEEAHKTEQEGNPELARKMLEKMGLVQQRKTDAVIAREFRRKCQKEAKEDKLVEVMLQGGAQQQPQVREVVREVVVQAPGGGAEERRKVQRDMDRLGRGEGDGARGRKVRGPSMVDGARWGMPGIMVPEPGARLTAMTGHTLDAPPSGMFPGKCSVCGETGHKGVFCPKGVVTTHAGVKQCGALHMFKQGHFNKDGSDAKA